MATKDAKFEIGSPRERSPAHAAAVLFGIYIAMYLAVGGISRAVESTEALAAGTKHHWVHSTSQVNTPVASAPEASPMGHLVKEAVELPGAPAAFIVTDEFPMRVLRRAVEPADSARECAPPEIDALCIYN